MTPIKITSIYMARRASVYLTSIYSGSVCTGPIYTSSGSYFIVEFVVWFAGVADHQLVAHHLIGELIVEKQILVLLDERMAYGTDALMGGDE